MTSEDERWAKLFRYLDKRFKAVDKRFDQVDERFIRLEARVEGIAVRQDEDDTERKFMIAQLDRHELWINQLAVKTHTKLDH